MEGIEKLLNRRVRIGLKTMLMTYNSNELSSMEKIAKDFGVKFRFDAALNPRLNGDRTPLSLRVPPEEAVEHEFSDEKIARAWVKFHDKHQWPLSTDDLYDCGAGVKSFHITPLSQLQACMMTPDIQFDLFSGSFAEGWNDIDSQIRKKKRRSDDDSPCVKCTKNHLCGYCPGFFRMETGFEDILSPYLCALGNSRFEHISATKSIEKDNRV
jgi:radical SAM protein with 4Fe4S-binding SPASM domain